MANNKGIIIAVFTCSLMVGCASSQNDDLWDLKEVSDPGRLNISYRAEQGDYRRTRAMFNQNTEGWIEQGVWQQQNQNDSTTVSIFIASLYNRAFSKDGIQEIKSLVESYSGDSYLEFDNQGVIKSNSGPVDYIFYRASGQPCVLARSYWSDPWLDSTAFRLLSANWIAGDTYIRTFYCHSGGDDLDMSDLNDFLAGIHARNLYWPENKFIDTVDAF